MKKTALYAAVLVSVAAASFWFGQRRGLEDFAQCLERGGVPVGAGRAGQEVADSASVLGKWRLISNEDISRVFEEGGTYRDFYGEDPEGDTGKWEIAKDGVAIFADGERMIFSLETSPEGRPTLLPVGGDPFDGFVR
jgi:hypothetical protein